MTDPTELRVTIRSGWAQEYRIARIIGLIERVSGVASVEEVDDA